MYSQLLNFTSLTLLCFADHEHLRIFELALDLNPFQETFERRRVDPDTAHSGALPLLEPAMGAFSGILVAHIFCKDPRGTAHFLSFYIRVPVVPHIFLRDASGTAQFP